MAALLGRIHRASLSLSLTGWLNIVLLLVFLPLAAFDQRAVTGVNAWFKPIKFASSIALYCWTLALILAPLPAPASHKRAIRWGVSLAMLAEIVLITMQAARGVPSHFNDKTLFDGAVFQIMGLAIMANTALAIWALMLYIWRPPHLPAAIILGIRIGLFLFMVGSMDGLLMVLNQAHTVGAPDGGPGLPFLNWSTRHGDMRVAHAVGLHALQVMPLAGLAAERWLAGRSARLTALMLFAFAYLAVFVVTFRQAVAGQPFFSF